MAFKAVYDLYSAISLLILADKGTCFIRKETLFQFYSLIGWKLVVFKKTELQCSLKTNVEGLRGRQCDSF